MIYNTKTILEIISSIGTLLAALAALFTIRQIQTQRKAGMRPKMGILPKVAKYKITSEGINKLINESDLGELPIFFQIVNFGQGPAELVEVNITYSYSLLISAIIDTSHGAYSFEYDNDNIILIHLKTGKKVTVPAEGKEYRSEHLLLASKDTINNTIKITLEQTFFDLLVLTINTLNHKDEKEKLVQKLPIITYKFKYRDLESKIYTATLFQTIHPKNHEVEFKTEARTK